MAKKDKNTEINLDEAFFKAAGYSFIGDQHAAIKQVKSIISNTKPNPQKLFIAEGLWSFKKITEFNPKIFSLFVCPEHIVTAEAKNAFLQVAEKTNERYVVSAKTFEKVSERDKPDGLLAIAKLPSYTTADIKLTEKSIALILDGIEIPGNVGTMLRMADGAGIDAVFIVNKKARLSHPKLIKGSMGAVLSVPFMEFNSVEECQTYLYSNGFKIYLADTRAEKFYFEEAFGCRTALVMGSERYGISRGWYDKPNTMLSIPMQGSCDSLNVAVAATVLAYEAATKNKFNR